MESEQTQPMTLENITSLYYLISQSHSKRENRRYSA